MVKRKAFSLNSNYFANYLIGGFFDRFKKIKN